MVRLFALVLIFFWVPCAAGSGSELSGAEISWGAWYDVGIDRDFLLIATGTDLAVLDVLIPEQPRVVAIAEGFQEIPYWQPRGDLEPLRHVVVLGDVAVTAARELGVVIWDLSAMDRPRVAYQDAGFPAVTAMTGRDPEGKRWAVASDGAGLTRTYRLDAVRELRRCLDTRQEIRCPGVREIAAAEAPQDPLIR